MRSTSPADHRIRPWAAAFWLIVWQLAAMLVDERLLLASPAQTLAALAGLVPTPAFWLSILFTMLRILAGFLLATVLGVALAALSARYVRVRELLAPPLAGMRSVPVASFVIVALIWIPSRNLSILISFLVAMPILYADALSGIGQADAELLEMARLFRIPPMRQIRHIYIPTVLPRFRSALGVAMGLAWKSGVAAEVIGIPDGSIGERLYQAKLYLATPELFSWTLTIVLMSLLCEKLTLIITAHLLRRMEESRCP